MKKMYPLVTMILGLTLAGCEPAPEERGGEAEPMQPQTGMAEPPPTQVAATERSAFANINPASGSNVNGYATFTGRGDRTVEFSVRINNASPGEHAVHLHETGDCGAPDATSAGGHWNPDDTPHGKRNTGSFHKGDIGNLQVGEDGHGSMTMTIEGWCIEGMPACDVLGRAVIVHAGADDFTTQPAGDAGARVGCGVVRRGHYQELPGQQSQNGQ